jgi:hypothetical protein
MSKFAPAFASIVFASGLSVTALADDAKIGDDRADITHQEATTDVGPILEKLDADRDGYKNVYSTESTLHAQWWPNNRGLSSALFF